MKIINSEINTLSINSGTEYIYTQAQIPESKLSAKENKNSITKNICEKEQVHKFYTFPKYYDMAFNRDVDGDIKFFQKCFYQYSEVEVKRVLEPACGTGIFLKNFPRYGYNVLGYDLSNDMVSYSKDCLQKARISQNSADVILGNMKDLVFDSSFDAAIICINSLGYLTREEDILSHFKAMGRSIKKGGIYIVELSCKCENIATEKKIDDTWYVREDGTELEMTWVIKRYDLERRIRHVEFSMVVNDNGTQFKVEESHELRLWLFDEFKHFANTCGFKLVGIYTQKYEEISQDIPINGELGGLFFILKNI